MAFKTPGGNYAFFCITGIDGNTYQVKTYLNNYKYSAAKQDLTSIPSDTMFSEGDKVFAVWSNGRFYDGVLGKTENKGARVKWNDGSKEIFVEYMMMIKK